MANDLASPKRLPGDFLQRFAQPSRECIWHVAKHAHASCARVAFGRDEDALRFEIADDGCGGADPSGGTGILGLRDRAEAAGGTLFVVSPPGKGTVVSGALPLGIT